MTTGIPPFLQSSRDAVVKTRMREHRGRFIPSRLAALDSVVTDDAIIFHGNKESPDVTLC